jgi:nitrite reductase (NO-forming)
MVEVPGTYTLVDHAVSRASKGGAGQLVIEGTAAPDVYSPA